MSEQLRLEQRVGDRAAIDADKWFPRAFAVVVDRPGDELLPRAAFTDDEDRRRRIRRVGDLFVHFQHRRRPADEAADRTGRRVGRRLRLASPQFERATHDALHVGDHEGLADVIERPGANRLDRRFQCAEPADEHDGSPLVRLEPAQQVEAGPRRIQVDIRDQQIEGIRPDLHQGAVGILHRHELPVRRLEQFLEELARRRVVVDYKDSGHGSAALLSESAAGRSMTNDAPTA